MAVLTISVWALFFTVFFLNDEPVYPVASSPQTVSALKTEASATLKRFEAVEKVSEEQENQYAVVEEKPQAVQQPEAETLEERASSPYNDILYDFERDDPISIDELLFNLGIND